VLAAHINIHLDSVRARGTISSWIGPDVKLADTFVDRIGAIGAEKSVD
jgi:hypothetical protein